LRQLIKDPSNLFFPNKCLFIHIPKTGGSSLEHAIANKYLEGEPEGNIERQAYSKFTVHGHFEKREKGNGGHPHSFIKDYAEHLNIENYYKFVVLRNPFEQVVSLYNQIRVSANIPSLEHFILGDKNFTMKQVDHYIDQYKFTHIDGELMVDKIFVFDRYHEAQNFVEDKFNLTIDRDKKLWKTKYTGETLSMEAKTHFESVYHQSIELYNQFLFKSSA